MHDSLRAQGKVPLNMKMETFSFATAAPPPPPPHPVFLGSLGSLEKVTLQTFEVSVWDPMLLALVIGIGLSLGLRA